MKLKTHICKKTPTNSNSDYLSQNSSNQKNVNTATDKNNEKSMDNMPLSCVDWSSNDEIYFVR